jgi:hypothetical protein
MMMRTQTKIAALPRRHVRMIAVAAWLALAGSANIVAAANAPRPAQQEAAIDGTPEQIAQANPRASTTSSNERPVLFFALFDCSWENARRGPTGSTTIKTFYEKLLPAAGLNMHVEYVKTDCARENWFMSRDRGKAVFDRQLEKMYAQLIARVTLWRMARRTQINVVSLGGSWGGAQAAGFSRMVHERGIPNPPELTVIEEGKVDSRQFFVKPGQVKQVVVMFDPVGTMVDLPPSVLSGLQFAAKDEHRENFRSVPIIPDGHSSDGRLMGMKLPGSHSDICGGYEFNGLAIRIANMAISYINRLSENPIMKELALPSDPKFDVIHMSEQEEI